MKKKIILRIGLGVLAGIVALVAVYCVLRFGFSIDVLDQSGWDTKDGTTRYLDYWGKPRTGWLEVDGKKCYFVPESGAMAIGWNNVEGRQYYFGEDGDRATGWLEVDGKHYYLDDGGVLVTGWLAVDGQTYYFAPEDGAMTVGWLTLEDKQYYFNQEGATVAGWQELEDGRRWFADDGSMVTGWVEDDSGRYFLGEDGLPQTGWLDWEEKHYFLKDDGSVTIGWMEDGQDRYYFLPSGRMAIGEVEIDGVSRFFTSKGKEVLMCNPWHPIPADFELDLVALEGKMFDASAKEPMEQMLAAGRAEGIVLGINNSYRSHANQQSSWNASIAQMMEEGLTEEQAKVFVGKALAIPGHSEHETGLAFDINSGYKVYEWLGEHCWEYGFILRYPEDKVSITGIQYEPWHFRYVGTELSLELKELDQCMEEYMTELTAQQKRIAD